VLIIHSLVITDIEVITMTLKGNAKMDMIPFEEWIGLAYLMPGISFGLNQPII